jgi:hypothetical protein
LASASRFSTPARLAQHVVTVALETLLHFRRIGKVRRIRDGGERRDVFECNLAFSMEFRCALDELVDAAQHQSADGAAFHYMGMAIACVSRHRFVCGLRKTREVFGTAVYKLIYGRLCFGSEIYLQSTMRIWLRDYFRPLVAHRI